MIARFLKDSAVKVPVLLYHHVGSQREGTYPGLTISPNNFERQIRWLAGQGFNGIRPSDWLRHHRQGTALPDKPILVTFDDGYADIADYALPIIREVGFSAAVFIVTSLVGKTNAWDEAKGWGTLALMDAKQIRYWSSQGIEFGAHSRTHPDLTKLSYANLLDEISGSKIDLEHILGTPIHLFAYPHGRHNDKIVDYVQNEFSLAFTTDGGVNRPWTAHSRLKRIDVPPEASLAFLHFSTHSETFWIFKRLGYKLRLRARLARQWLRQARLTRREKDLSW